MPTADKRRPPPWARDASPGRCGTPEASLCGERPPEDSGQGRSWGNGENEPQGPRSFSPACLHCVCVCRRKFGDLGANEGPTSWKDRV